MRFYLIMICWLIVGFKTNAQLPRLTLSLQHNMNIVDVVVSPDKKYIGTIAKDSTAKLWFVKEKLLLAPLDLSETKIIGINFFTTQKNKILIATPHSLIIY